MIAAIGLRMHHAETFIEILRRSVRYLLGALLAGFAAEGAAEGAAEEREEVGAPLLPSVAEAEGTEGIKVHHITSTSLID